MYILQNKNHKSPYLSIQIDTKHSTFPNRQENFVAILHTNVEQKHLKRYSFPGPILNGIV